MTSSRRNSLFLRKLSHLLLHLKAGQELDVAFDAGNACHQLNAAPAGIGRELGPLAGEVFPRLLLIVHAILGKGPGLLRFRFAERGDVERRNLLRGGDARTERYEGGKGAAGNTLEHGRSPTG